ncbi:hypothetical protein A2755_03915 [Candidatus Wolfebacteria bacterium RIFCSPHIGHO2_01_FULL_48_22]|nr:MAG: hypothetical protein A2755_03915 [Candidatus Wolfebacteria bacterium RIFCSPHIGHO2_01_FULL_48_22]
MKERGVTLAQLSAATEISSRYLQALIDGDTDNLPPAPYIRGYLQKIAEVLDVDFSVLWKYYESDLSIRKSGGHDTLPQNRFAVRPVRKGPILITGIIIVLLAIALPYLADFFGKPSLEISFPQEESFFSQSEQITITGRVGRAQDVVSINGTEVAVLQDGTFSKEVPLSDGANSFEIIAKRFLGQETRIVRNVFYRTEPFASPSPQPSTVLEISPSVSREPFFTE